MEYYPLTFGPYGITERTPYTWFKRQMTYEAGYTRPDELYHGDGWESLNPGYWKLHDQSLRRRLKNVGDQARATGYPFHWESRANRPMPVN